MNRILLSAALLLGVAACSGGAPAPGTSGSGNFVAEAFCDIDGLPRPARHTIVLLDSTVIAKTTTAEEFVGPNGWLRDAVMEVADPAGAIASEASAPRERITLISLPKDGSAGNRIFTGCIPAMTTEEIASARAKSSAVSDFFGGGVREKVKSEAEYFRVRLIAALQAAARSGEAGAASMGGPIAQRSLFTSLKNSQGLLESGQDAVRLVLVTDFSRTDDIAAANPAEARRAGFVAGQQFGLHLAGSDVVLVQQNASNPMTRSFLDAFFLAQQARVIHDGKKIAALPAPPVSMRRYLAQAMFPDGPANVEVRIGHDRSGKLTASWMTLRDQYDRSVPMLGQADCDSQDVCAVRSTNDDFGQSWSFSPGGEPEFDAQMPFGGLRNFELRLQGDKLDGRIFDPMVDQIGPTPGNNSIHITGTLRRDPAPSSK